MEDTTTFLVRLDATQAICAALRARPGALTQVLTTEHRALLALAGRVHFDGASMAEVVQKVQIIRFAEEDEVALLAKIAERLATPTAPTPARRGGAAPAGDSSDSQDFTSIVEFFPQKVWSYVSDSANGDVMVKFAVALGLRRASEHTKKALALAVLIGTEGLENVQRCPKKHRQLFAKTMKPLIKRYSVEAGDPNAWIQILPETPDKLKASHPELFADVYQSGPPVAPPFPINSWRLLCQETPCRDVKGFSEHLNFGGGSPVSMHRPPNHSLDIGMQMMHKMAMLQDQVESLRGGQRALPDQPATAPFSFTARGGARAGILALSDARPSGDTESGGRPSEASPGGPPGLAGGQPGAQTGPRPEAQPGAEPAVANAAVVPATEPSPQPGLSATKPPRLTVVDATAAILAQMDARKDEAAKAKKRKAGEDGAAVGAKAGRPKAKGNAQPKKAKSETARVWYNIDNATNAVHSYYNKLKCRTYEFSKKKGSQAEAEKQAKELNDL